MPAYKSSWFDRLGPDAASRVRSAVMAIGFSPLGAIAGATAAAKMGMSPAGVRNLAVLGAVLGGLCVYFFMRAIPRMGASAMQAALFPTGNTSPYETDFSFESSLAMKGDVKGALASFDEKILQNPLDVPVRLKAAEMHLGAGNYDRARELYRDVQRIPGVDARDDVTASYRLIDLYREKLRDPGKSLSEFRRLIERYPNSKVERQAREALAALKKEMTF